MNCNEVQDHLYDFVNNNLDKKLAVQVEQHLQGCASCSRQADLLKSLDKLIEYEKQFEPSAGLFERIKAETLDKNSKKARVISYQWMQKVAVAALVAIGVMLGNLLGKTYLSTMSTGQQTAAVQFEDQLFASYDYADEYFLLNTNLYDYDTEN